MDRRLFKRLESWKIKGRRKPLILMGARQVGKTYLLKQFAKEKYEQFVYLNFEDTPSLKKLFVESLEPAEIIRNIAIETGITIAPGKTLLIFDEVQECPEALNSLKYFCEFANEYHVCAAGSLLGVTLAHTKGFPVGKVDFLHLYPMGFFEFLTALGETALCDHLEEHNTILPFTEFLHEKLLRCFKVYMFVGGMPEAIATYVESKDFAEVRVVQNAILDAYSLDFAKHAPKNQLMKIIQTWSSIPGQLAKENKKFIYSVIRKGARAKEFEGALQWLVEAGLIHKVYNISTPKLPLAGYANFEFFKIYLLDCGLLGAMASLSAKAVIDGNSIFQEFQGSLTENYVAQELKRSEYDLYYWTSAGRAELDFTIQHEDAIYPLEVKSGSSGKKKSLIIYDGKYHPNLLVRISPMNLKRDSKVLNCPFYFLPRLSWALSRTHK